MKNKAFIDQTAPLTALFFNLYIPIWNQPYHYVIGDMGYLLTLC